MNKMRFKRFCFLAIVLSAFLISISGCTRTIRQSAALSEVGVNYADAMYVLLEVTADTVIEDDSDSLLYQQKLTQYEDKAEEKRELKNFLNEHDTVIQPIINSMGQFQSQTRVLKNYFINLQALASTDAPERTANVVEELSVNINAANKAIRESENILISDAEKTAIGKLAGLAAKSAQAAMLRKALERDAPIIAEQLLLHEKLLGKLSGMLKQSYAKKMVVLKKNEIRTPYTTKTIRNNEQWKMTRKKFLKSSFFEQNLDKAVTAAQQMRLIWEGIIEGKDDLNSIRLLLDDINEFTAIIHHLKKADQ